MSFVLSAGAFGSMHGAPSNSGALALARRWVRPGRGWGARGDAEVALAAPKPEKLVERGGLEGSRASGAGALPLEATR